MFPISATVVSTLTLTYLLCAGVNGVFKMKQVIS